MKFVLEIIVALIHPLGVLLSWINLAGRSDLGLVRKVLWAILCLIPVGPVLYILLGNGELW